MKRLADGIERGLTSVAENPRAVREHVGEVQQIATALSPASGTPRQRRLAFGRLRRRLKSSTDPVRRHMAAVMGAFVRGLFVGAGHDVAVDNLDLERWFRVPKVTSAGFTVEAMRACAWCRKVPR